MNFPMVPLGNVLTPIERPEVPTPGKIYRQAGVKLWGVGAYERESIDGSQTQYRTLSKVLEDDIIINKIWARNGSVAVIPENLSGCYVSSEFPLFISNKEELDPCWFHWLTKTAYFWEQCDEKSRGTSGKNRIRPEKFLEIEIPLPPLPEQQYIVARIEQLAEKIEEAKKLRREAVEERDAFALSGLKKILTPEEDWIIKNISDCSKMSTGTTPPTNRKDYFDGNLKWYTPGDLEYKKELGSSSRTLTNTAIAERKVRIYEPGTILLVAIGSIGKIGLTSEYCSSNQQITGIKFIEEILPEYGFWWMRSLQKNLDAAAPQATLRIINQRRIGEFKIAYPSIPLQHRIVSYLDSLQAKVDALKKLQSETKAELDALMPSILDRAFRGELI